MTGRRRPRARSYLSWTRVAVLAITIMVTTSSCSWVSSWFADDPAKPTDTSVFEVTPGMCFNPPPDVKVELASVARVPCDQPHSQEAYAIVAYTTSTGTADGYPGDAALKTFADGACAEAFAGYVGVNFQDSSLYYTYLLPSARSWEQASDRQVVCFVITTGTPLTASVAGSKL